MPWISCQRSGSLREMPKVPLDRGATSGRCFPFGEGTNFGETHLGNLGRGPLRAIFKRCVPPRFVGSPLGNTMCYKIASLAIWARSPDPDCKPIRQGSAQIFVGGRPIPHMGVGARFNAKALNPHGATTAAHMWIPVGDNAARREAVSHLGQKTGSPKAIAFGQNGREAKPLSADW